MGFNYVLVFSPNTLRDAPHNLAATIDLPPGQRDRRRCCAQLVRGFPSSSVIETGGAAARRRATLLDQMSLAILAAASVAVLAGHRGAARRDRRGAGQRGSTTP